MLKYDLLSIKKDFINTEVGSKFGQHTSKTGDYQKNRRYNLDYKLRKQSRKNQYLRGNIKAVRMHLRAQ